MPWPATIPFLTLTENYREDFPDGAFRTPMDGGAAKTRPNPNYDTIKIPFSQRMSSDQFETLKTFYFDELQNGSLSFSEFHPRTGDNESFKFVGGLQIGNLGGRYYQVSFTLEILPS